MRNRMMPLRRLRPWAWRAPISPCVAMPTCIAPAASMAAQDEFAPLCAIQGMSISHYASWANASRAINTIAVLCVHCDGNYRRSPITSIQSRRRSLIISICTTKAITDCCSKTGIRTCTDMHMHNHMFINYACIYKNIQIVDLYLHIQEARRSPIASFC